MQYTFIQNISRIIKLTIVFSFLLFAYSTHAATLSVQPGTAVYTAGQTFTARVVVNTQGKKINAAEGTLTFKPGELSVVRVNKGPIFSLWTAEPSFSNAAGSISFSGGTPAGYTGSNGTVLSVTFRIKGAGKPRVSFANGSVLAADGRGTNVLTAMNGAVYTVSAADIKPEPEHVVYVAPPNTPDKPKITSATHPDPNAWYATTTAKLQWSLPSDVTAVRTLLDSHSGSIPTKVYTPPIGHITLTDLDQGVQYFHLQFKNKEGWGKVNHYRLAVDTENPTSFTISLPKDVDVSNPVQTLVFDVKDATSQVKRYSIRIDEKEPFTFTDETGSSTVTLPSLEPGVHTVIVEAFDEAGNSIGSTFSFTIEAFDKPHFTEVPKEVSENVIPVIKGTTRPQASVRITFGAVGTDPKTYTVQADENGEFVFIPEGKLSLGVYEIQAVAVDERGAQSAVSDTVRMAVQQPGFVQVGSYAVRILSVFISLFALLSLLLFGFWFILARWRHMRAGVRSETKEALAILHKEFSALQDTLKEQTHSLMESRKNKKLTKAEAALVSTIAETLSNTQQKLEKEITDVEDVIDNNE